MTTKEVKRSKRNKVCLICNLIRIARIPMTVCLYVCLLVSLSVCLSVYLSVCRMARLQNYQVYIFQGAILFTYLHLGVFSFSRPSPNGKEWHPENKFACFCLILSHMQTLEWVTGQNIAWTGGLLIAKDYYFLFFFFFYTVEAFQYQ